MTLQRAHELIAMQKQFGGGCNRNAVRLIAGEPTDRREHGQPVVDGLIRDLGPEQAFGLEPAADFDGVGR